MYWFGESKDQKEIFQQEIWAGLTGLSFEYSQTSLDSILDTLHAFGEQSRCGGVFYERSIELLKEQNSFSEEEIKKSLLLIPEIFNKENLKIRLEAEIGSGVLENFRKIDGSFAKMKAFPVGIVTHVTAGNVFLSAIDSLVMGLMTKNLNIVKLSSSNQAFPMFLAQELCKFDTEKIVSNKFAMLVWKGGDEEIEQIIKEHSHLIIAWGGEEMIRSYRRNLPLKTKLLEMGPKFSFQLITKNGVQGKSIDKVASMLVADILPWNQRACSAPQNLFIEEGVDVSSLLGAVDRTLRNSSRREGTLNDEFVEIHKEYYRSLYSQLMGEGQFIAGEDYLVHLEEDSYPRPSALNRTLIVKKFKTVQELSLKLKSIEYYLQTCSYLVSNNEKSQILDLLSWSGVKRFTPLGTSSLGMNGTPHDGRFVLADLVHLVADEVQNVDYGETYQKNDSHQLKNEFESSVHPLGYIFSSGGTTGEPKYVHFSNEEFSYISDMLAINLEKQGVVSGEVVANLFVAGNLWSSFLAMDRALEKLGAISLPIGGQAPIDNVINYLMKFKPKVIMGIPSLLVIVAERMKQQGLHLKIDKLFYAGERLFEGRIQLFREVWNVEYFGSAGYASVDAGVIGYQCKHSLPGEHHLFSRVVRLQVIDDEAVVTPIYRNTLNLKNYHTGDSVELINSPCACGSLDQKFKLLGRTDDLIQIWSARIRLLEIETVLARFGLHTYRLEISESGGIENLTMEIESDQEMMNFDSALYELNDDLKASITFAEFQARLTIVWRMPGTIKRNERTGKISITKDLR